MQARLLRCSHCAPTRRPIAKALVALNGARTIANKPKPWNKVKQKSRLLVFDPNSYPKVNSAIILQPPSESIVVSVNNRNKSLKEAEESLGQFTPTPYPSRKFRANTPFYFPAVKKNKEEALVQFNFSAHTAQLLRHTARNKGLRILPDGFARVSDVMRDEFYKDYTFDRFAELCQKDPSRDFDLVHMPDFIEGQLEDVWWVRAKRAHSMIGIDSSDHRILNMARLKTAICLCEPRDSDNIRQYGIPEQKFGRIRIHRTLENALFETMHFPARLQHLCISIDSEVAARNGVMFFSTQARETYAVGNVDGIIPPQALLGATLLDLRSTNLLHRYT